MIGKIASKMDREDEGFTLIELMVVVLIIGILVAIALPTFLGARSRAQDKAAESNLRNGIAAAKTLFTDNSSYASFTVANATTAEPSLSWQPTGTDPATVAGNNVVVIQVASASQVELISYSASNKYFCISDDSSAGTKYNDAATLAAVQGMANCAGTAWP